VNVFVHKSNIGFYNLSDISVFELLNKMLETMMLDLKRPFLAALTEDIHVLPDFHGNR
jgi:ribulose kinase